MADNYLEKRMEDYHKGSLPSAVRLHRTPSGAPKGTAQFRLGVERVFVAVAAPALREAVVRRFAATGCRTAFIAADRAASSAFAQQTGALFIPAEAVDPAEAARAIAVADSRWDDVELVVADRPSLLIPGRRATLIAAGETAEAAGAAPDTLVNAPGAALTDPAAASAAADAALFAATGKISRIDLRD